MDNTFELNEINDVDLGDDSLTAYPTLGSSVSARIECTPYEHVNLVCPVVVESGDGDGDVVVQSGAGSGAEVGVKVGQQPSKRRKCKRLPKFEMTFLLLQ